MPNSLKMLVLVLSLGIDILLISTSLGVIKTKGKLKIAFVFACAEAIMPLIGLFIGKGAGQLIGHWASLIGGILLIGVSIWLIFFENEDEVEEKLERNLIGWTLIMTAISISLDELAVGVLYWICRCTGRTYDYSYCTSSFLVYFFGIDIWFKAQIIYGRIVRENCRHSIRFTWHMDNNRVITLTGNKG